MKINKPGELLATAFCNIHGLWENSKPIQLK
jgi:superoxide reductase